MHLHFQARANFQLSLYGNIQISKNTSDFSGTSSLPGSSRIPHPLYRPHRQHGEKNNFPSIRHQLSHGASSRPRNIHRWPTSPQDDRLRSRLHTLALLDRHARLATTESTRQRRKVRRSVCHQCLLSQQSLHHRPPLTYRLTHSTAGANPSPSTGTSPPFSSPPNPSPHPSSSAPPPEP